VKKMFDVLAACYTAQSGNYKPEGEIQYIAQHLSEPHVPAAQCLRKWSGHLEGQPLGSES
jgi:hypothetical protein